MLRLPPLMLLAALLLLLVIAAVGCGARRVAVGGPPAQSFGFTDASGLFLAERDVQWTGTTAHCIVRLVLASAPDSVAAYVEVAMEWCAGIQ